MRHTCFICAWMCVCECFFTIINSKLMVRKMLAMANTVWSAEMARVKDVAVYDTRTTENMKMKNVSGVDFSPAQETSNIRLHVPYQKNMNDGMRMRMCVWPIIQYTTQLKMTAGIVRRNRTVRQDLGQEVHRDSVVSADVLVPEDTPTTTSSSINQSKILITINQHCNCTENTTGRILKDKLILSWYFLLNFLFLEKKRIFCIPEKCLLTQNLRIIKIIENNL